MRRAVITVLIVGLMLCGPASLVLADGPGWVPRDFKRGGGDELESSGRFDPVDDENPCGISPSGSIVTVESGVDRYLRVDAGRARFFGPDDWVWWVLLLPSQW